MNNTPRKVLIVEDSELLQTSYSLLFPLLFQRHRAEGCEIVRAMNGEEGLRRLTEHPDCDLIVLDINMPVMSGLEFLEHCKGVSLFADIPVIICSTEGEEEDIIRGLEAGAAGYIVKPFDLDELVLLIDKVLRSKDYQEPVRAS